MDFAPLDLYADDEKKRPKLALATGPDGAPRLTLAQPDADLEGLRAAQDADQSREGNMRFARAGEQAAAAMLRRAPDYTGIEPNQQQALKAYLQQRAQVGEAQKQAAAQAHEQRAGEQWSAGHELDLKKYLSEKAAKEREATQGEARLKLEGGKLALDRERLGQEQWAYAANPVTGAAGKFNKKTGQWVAIEGPQGPGGLPPMKPQELRADTEKLGAKYEPIAEISVPLKVLNAAAEASLKSGEVPGFGMVEGHVPARTLAWAKDVPQDQIDSVRMAAKSVRATLLKIQSGSGVTEGERKEIGEILGLIESGNASQFRTGLKMLNGLMQRKAGAIKAQFDPAVDAEYGKRPGAFRPSELGGGDDGGTIYLDKPSAAPSAPAGAAGKAPASDTVRVEYQGQKMRIPKARLAQALKDGAKVVE